ncbi:MAG: HNH endonuclease [Candidatus Zixiibacteriota bacterium]
MKDQIISFREMCDNENIQTLQRGMNYRLNANYSVILMSQRSNAPYNDKICDDGISIEYEGHDLPKTKDCQFPKKFDQPRTTMSGKLTQNGKFAKAVDDYKNGTRKPEIIRVYEKLISGVWSEKGFFNLVDYTFVKGDNNRKVFIFKLSETDFDIGGSDCKRKTLKTRSRIIPSEIKKEVWIRDKGKCVICGAKDELHFDHDLPYSKGGTSITADNVRILCARHNLQKSDKIE